MLGRRVIQLSFFVLADLAVIAGVITVPQLQAQIALQRVATGLSQPVFATSAPGVSNQLFIVEQRGAIRTLNLTTGTLASAPVITIGNLATGFEQGLLGLAFDPNYATNGFFYTNAVEQGGTAGRTVINRYQMTGNPLTSTTANTTSANAVLSFDQPFANHNGGWIGFSPRDNLLYIASGDGGSGNDPLNAGQRLDTLLGKMLRIDPSVDGFGGDPTRNYSIPSSNPFVGNASAQAEIWAYGVRNPYRASFDRLTGDLWMGDVGQAAREEVNFQAASSSGGENYGWRLREGTIATPTVGGDPPAGAIEPVYDYLHGTGPLQGNSVTGGYVYRGTNPLLQGKYVFGDFASGNVWAFNYDGTTLSNFMRLNDQFVFDTGTLENVSSFAEDSIGNLYIVDYDGDIFRISAVPEPSSLVLCLGIGVVFFQYRRHTQTRKRLSLASKDRGVETSAEKTATRT
jgi:glucose/arabinose dehydrogenase